MVLNRPPCDRCIKAKVACVKWGKAGGCERCAGQKVKCSGVQKKDKEPAVVVEVPRKRRETRSSGTVDGGTVLLEEVKGLRTGMDRMAGSMDRMAGSFDKMVGLMSEWLKRGSHTVDFEADERFEETLDDYLVAGGSGELGEKSGQESAVPLFLPEPMDL